jgi:putative FmdB family regulatory protein
MPIYEFVCKKCSHEFEEIIKISDPLPAECPECHVKGEIHKKITAAAFHLKGGGWYNDAYSSKKAAETKSSDPKKDSAESASSKSADATPSSAAKDKVESPSSEAKPAAAEKKASEPVS